MSYRNVNAVEQDDRYRIVDRPTLFHRVYLSVQCAHIQDSGCSR